MATAELAGIKDALGLHLGKTSSCIATELPDINNYVSFLASSFGRGMERPDMAAVRHLGMHDRACNCRTSSRLDSEATAGHPTSARTGASLW